MSASASNQWAFYGGAGFIGQHLALSILQRFPVDRVWLLDIQDPAEISWKAPLDRFLGSGRLTVRHCDVRDAASLGQNAADFDTIVNLAAIHREPGHRVEEYFATNVSGAEHICQLAEETGCQEIIFTSSIAVYGEFDTEVDEDSTPAPKTAYGQSKLQAEQIHLDWAKKTGGQLSIIRPGVVFGPGEGGNVSRLVNESLHRKRAIQLKPDLAKAGIYIEELLGVMHWLRLRVMESDGPLLVNGVSAELLHFNDYGKALQVLQGFEKSPMTLPISGVSAALKLLRPATHLFSATSKFHPERLLKLTRPNSIRSKRLSEWGYPYAWPLDRAMADWLGRGI